MSQIEKTSIRQQLIFLLVTYYSCKAKILTPKALFFFFNMCIFFIEVIKNNLKMFLLLRKFLTCFVNGFTKVQTKIFKLIKFLVS